MDMSPHTLTAIQAAAAIKSGELTSEDLVRACLARIDEVEDTVQAWTFLDRDHAIVQARAADLARKEGRTLGPLHGVPVGIKDVFDTADMPTEDGTVLHAGRRPLEDSTVVALLRAAGAVIMGKTVTTEFAVYSPGKTRNPHNPEHTPGGSSSGSAAAVAAGMVALAVGTQTNGSVIRPASFCGVVGFKPSFGLISRHGVLRQSPLLDSVGVFARTVEDAALLAETLMAYDANDAAVRPRARPALVETARSQPPVGPRFAFVQSPVWDKADDDTKAAFANFCADLGERVQEVDLPPAFNDAIEWHRAIMEADLAKSFRIDEEKGRDRISPVLLEMMDRGKTVSAVGYNQAVDGIARLGLRLAELFEAFDAIITPATIGPAPKGLESTGSPIFCTLWTFCGVPSVSLPLLEGANGLPMGVQVVGAKGDDARLLRSARWLSATVAP